jgi:hypothetical protein
MALAITELLRVLPTISLKLGGVSPPPPSAHATPLPTPLDARKLCSLVISMPMSLLQDVGRDAGTGGGQEGQLPLLPFARRGMGGRSALCVMKYYLINHISSDAFWAKS